MIKEREIKDNNASLEVSCTLMMERTKVNEKIKFLLVQFWKEIINKGKRYFKDSFVSTKYMFAATVLLYQHLAFVQHIEKFRLLVRPEQPNIILSAILTARKDTCKS
jgi:hypothetical protein